MIRWLMLTLMSVLLVLTGCGTENAGQTSISSTSPMIAKYDFFSGDIPFPNNFLFSGSIAGKLNLTVVDSNNLNDPDVALNALDGFSTNAPLITSFNSPIDVTTISPSSVRLFEVTNSGLSNDYAVTGIVSELSFGIQYKARVSLADPKTLIVDPIVPLKSNKTYLAVVTNALKSTSGDVAQSSMFFSLLKNINAFVLNGVSQVPGYSDVQAQQLEALRLSAQGMFGALESIPPAIPRANVVTAWSFKTQTVNKVLAKIQTASATDPYATNALNFVTSATPPVVHGDIGVIDFYSYAVSASVAGNTSLIDAYTASPSSYNSIGSVVTGSLKLPYYIEDTYTNPMGPVTGTFQLDVYGAPVIRTVQTVPFLLTIPKGVAPVSLGNKWPVAIFQHDYASDKSDIFGIANAFAKSGFAVVAIDTVLHGGRTFNLDLIDNTTGNTGSDGNIDLSGAHYFNLESLLTSRDNVRQSVADLVHLVRLLEVQNMDVVNNTSGLPTGAGDGPDLVINTTTPVSFVGHGMGGALGIMLAAVEPSVKAYALANTGGGYVKTFESSIIYSSIIDRGLSRQGIAKGSIESLKFLAKAQTVLDDAEPLNYARQAIASGKSVFLMKTLEDADIANAQTDALFLTLGLRQVAFDPSVSNWSLGVLASPIVGSGFSVFTQGGHTSFLTPSPVGVTGEDILFEMQSEAVLYLVNGVVGNATISIGANPLPSASLTSTVVQ